MNEPTNPPQGADIPTPTGPSLRVLAQYIKDLSFENPAAATPQMAERPDIGISVDVSVRPHAAGDAIFEVVLKLSAQATAKEEPLFLCELVYGGLFELVGVSESDAEPLLLIECPRLLFPFARRIMAEVTREGGFPPLMIDPIDFVSLYRQQKARGRENGASDGAAEA